jgi:hypothetical protein
MGVVFAVLAKRLPFIEASTARSYRVPADHLRCS